MAYKFWYLALPTPSGKRLKGESITDHINRELTEVVERGWEPVSIASSSPLSFSFLLRKPSA